MYRHHLCRSQLDRLAVLKHKLFLIVYASPLGQFSGAVLVPKDSLLMVLADYLANPFIELCLVSDISVERLPQFTEHYANAITFCIHLPEQICRSQLVHVDDPVKRTHEVMVVFAYAILGCVCERRFYLSSTYLRCLLFLLAYTDILIAVELMKQCLQHLVYLLELIGVKLVNSLAFNIHRLAVCSKFCAKQIIHNVGDRIIKSEHLRTVLNASESTLEHPHLNRLFRGNIPADISVSTFLHLQFFAAYCLEIECSKKVGKFSLVLFRYVLVLSVGQESLGQLLMRFLNAVEVFVVIFLFSLLCLVFLELSLCLFLKILLFLIGFTECFLMPLLECLGLLIVLFFVSVSYRLVLFTIFSDNACEIGCNVKCHLSSFLG